MISPVFKKYLNWLGSMLSLAGILFVVMRLQDYDTKAHFERLTILSWFAIVNFGILYGLCSMMLAFGWHHLLIYFKVTPPRLWSIRTYGFSQLAKYVPGNIFHLAGRQSLGMAAGYPGWALIKSSFWELAICSLSASLFGVLLLPFIGTNVSIFIFIILFFILISLIFIGLKFYFTFDVAMSFSWFLLFFTSSSFIFMLIIRVLFNVEHLDISLFILICGAYVIAWLIGFITPGAPAGVGIRELVLIFLLNKIISESDLILSVMIMRIVTVIGDVLFFIFAIIINFFGDSDLLKNIRSQE